MKKGSWVLGLFGVGVGIYRDKMKEGVKMAGNDQLNIAFSSKTRANTLGKHFPLEN